MGLFSFFKGKGSKLPDASKAPAEVVETPKNTINEWQLRYILSDNGFEVENLKLEINDDSIYVAGLVENQEIREKVVLALGNVEGVACIDDGLEVKIEEDPSDFYEVKSGDSLSKISKNFYGNANLYNKIFEANQPLLKSPDLIYPGQVLRIPKK